MARIGSGTAGRAEDLDALEDIFRRISDEYVKNYLPAYNRYARAYFDKKQYVRSLKKLNDAYSIAPAKPFPASMPRAARRRACRAGGMATARA